MHLMCLMPHLLPFIFSSSLGHPSVPTFSHSMHFICLLTTCTTIQQQLQPANLSIFHSCMFLCHSFSYQLTYQRSICSCLFFFISHFIGSHSIDIPASPYTLYHHLLSHLTLRSPRRLHSVIPHYPHSYYCFPY